MNLFSSLTVTLCFLLMPQSMAQETLSKEGARKELSKVYRDISAIKQEYNKIVSEIRKAKHPELEAIEKKARLSFGPISKAQETHPDFAEIRARRDNATTAWEKAVKDGDQDAAKKAVKERSAAKNELTKAAYQHKDIIPLIKAREALGKEREAVKVKLVTEKNPEIGKKMNDLETRKAELRKIIYGK